MILTWKTDTQESAPCPDFVRDEYTGQYPNTHCLVYHFTTRTVEHSKHFATEKEAEEFKEKAPQSCYDWHELK